MRLQKLNSANEFLLLCEGVLLKNETQNNLILGLADRLVSQPQIGDAKLFYAIFDDSDSELEHQLVKFTRYAVYDRNVMLVAVDVINGETDQPFIVVELKVYPGKEALLIEAMRYVMHRYPAMQTTHHKIDLLEY